MATRKVRLTNNMPRVVRVASSAGNGSAPATAAADAVAAPAAQPSSVAATVWRLILEIPANVQKLVAGVGDLVAGANVHLSGTLSGRLVGAGNVTLSAQPWWFDPPLAEDFELATGDADDVVLDDDADVGLRVENDIGTAGVIRYAYKEVPAGDWEVTARCTLQALRAAAGGGLFAIESTTGQYMALVLFGDEAEGLQARLGEVGGTYTSDTAAGARETAFLRLAREGTDLVASFSSDGKNFLTLATEPVTTAFTVEPDRVALGMLCDAASPSALSCDHWRQSW